MSTTANQVPRDSVTPPKPWWQHFYVWLVLAGPIVVVFAGFYTYWIAQSGADGLVKKTPEVNANAPIENPALLPAVQGRNKASEIGAGGSASSSGASR